MYNPFLLIDKTILVTGASSGIGRATAIECSKLGAKLIITARNEQRLKATLAALEGGCHQMILADLTKQSDVDNLINSLPKLDGLVNDAGINIMKPVSFIKQKDLDDTFRINTFASVLLASAILKNKRMNKNASIVMISSIASMTCTPGNSIYGMSKSAIESFVKYCALEVQSKGIRVNSIHPGMVDTAMTQNPALSAEEENADRQNYIQKRYGDPKEIALAVVYLLSDATKWMTGSRLVIDGGIHLH